jgi:aminopeptidase N/puromycin-sensitive aminopeptidase
MRRLAIALAVLLALPSLAQRLPRDVIPSNYQLRFVPDLDAATFSGEERITVDVKASTKAVVLNSAEIDFDEVAITSAGKTQKARVSTDEDREMATFTVATPLAAGPASIAIRFRGTLNDKLRGFYLSRSSRRNYAVTQFEPTDARRAFPSFDEPAMKATYDITIVVDDGDTAISNARIAKDEPGPGSGKHTLTFERTAKMSTYLVALLVGDWQCSEGGVDGVPIRICAVPENKDLTKWALPAAEAELHFYNDYYGIKYPFGKLDIIAIPDFEAGAMENAGAITFRETALLIDDANAAVSQYRTVASVNAHEIAHMWFGDLVTMQWWNDIWLNEGFATWITSKPVAAWKPEWNVRVEEAAETRNSLGVDALESTRPIRAKADTPAEINQMFDGIAYGKTAAVLRMLESYTGEEAFREGIRAYVKKYSFANAQAEDFWSSMTATTKMPIDRIMPTFVTQAGAPLVSASAHCQDGSTLLTLAQRRMFSRRAPFLAGTPQLWTIPVTVRNLDDPAAAPQKFLLAKKEETFRMAGCSPHFFINYDGRGFYRASHAVGMIDPSADLTKTLSPSERVALVSDSWALVRIGETGINAHLALVERLRDDRERAVVDTIVDQLTAIGLDLVTEAEAPAYRRWLAAYLRPIMSEIGWTPKAGEPDEMKRMRAKVVSTLGYVARDEETLRRARELTTLALNDPTSVDPTLLDVVVDLAAIDGDAAFFQQINEARKHAKSPHDYYRDLNALLAFENPDLRKQAFAMALSPEMRNQDLPDYVGRMFDKPEERAAAWEFVKGNWSELRKSFTPWGGARIVGSTANFCDPKQREDVRQFFAANPVEASERSLKQALERIDMCVELRTLQAQNLASWLSSSSHGG